MIFEFGVVIVLGGGLLIARELFLLEFNTKRRAHEAKAKRAYILSRSDGAKEWYVDGERYRTYGGQLQWANMETTLWEDMK